jgi:acyl-CoA dehydrogenase
MSLPYRSPWLTEELEAFRATVRRFFETEVAPFAERWETQQYVDRSVWRKAGEIGMLCVSVPTEYGGMGGSFLHEAIIIEEQARVGDCAFGVVLANMGVPIFLHAASEPQKHQWIPRLASGESTFAFALTEPGAGSDAKAITTTARRQGDSYVINGSKTFISNGYNGDVVLLAARTADTADPSKGISLFMLDTRGLEGYRVGRILKKMGQKGQDTAELFFDDVRIPAENLIGSEENQGFKQLMNGLRTERAVLGLIAVATAERAVRLTVDHVKNRKAFGKTLWDLQNTRLKLAECQTQVHIARIFVDHCIQLAAEDRLDSSTAAMCKWWNTELQNKVIDECVQLHGGYGYMAEYPIARMWADARIQRIYGGATEVQKEVVARFM